MTTNLNLLTLAYERAREDERICHEFRFPVPLSVVLRRQTAEELLERALRGWAPKETV
jgi:hypothetical protein